jgi:hypothetical protein
MVAGSHVLSLNGSYYGVATTLDVTVNATTPALASPILLIQVNGTGHTANDFILGVVTIVGPYAANVNVSKVTLVTPDGTGSRWWLNLGNASPSPAPSPNPPPAPGPVPTPTPTGQPLTSSTAAAIFVPVAAVLVALIVWFSVYVAKWNQRYFRQ